MNLFVRYEFDRVIIGLYFWSLHCFTTRARTHGLLKQPFSKIMRRFTGKFLNKTHFTSALWVVGRWHWRWCTESPRCIGTCWRAGYNPRSADTGSWSAVWDVLSCTWRRRSWRSWLRHRNQTYRSGRIKQRIIERPLEPKKNLISVIEKGRF